MRWNRFGALVFFGLFLALGAGVAHAADAPKDPAARKKVWLESEFRCRAISTTKMRKCRLETKDEKVTLAFSKADITCTVEFDDGGDPARLVDCAGKWLKVPKTNALKRAKRRPIWSGSKKDWTWKSDGETYCCPGMWIEAPKPLQ